jgi:1-acyl-sn-glycerol-3-phosphate acyltransferase
VLRLALRLFFRRVEVAGLERVPLESPVIFVINHPNGLVDPAFILAKAPRRVSFLAKAPLFRMPLISYFVRALDSLPVYRRQDEGEDVSRNRETFEQARRLLERGGTLAICPEGVSHDEPRLRPLKSGTARIALGAASQGEGVDLKIVPAGLYYTSKTTFRSSALLYFGEPLKVLPVSLDENNEPPREAVQELSERIERALRKVMLDAGHAEALATISRAERIFSSETEAAGGKPSLERELMLRQRFIEGYAFHLANSPERLAHLDARISRYEEELAQAGLDPHELSAPSSRGSVAFQLITRAVLVLLIAPFALLGAVIHYPAYRLAGFSAVRFSQNGEDIVSTIKILASMLLFPLTWGAAALLLFKLLGWAGVALGLLVVPLTGYAAVRFYEEFDRFVGTARAIAFFVTRRWFFKRLIVERRAIHEEILALGEEAANAVS